MGPWTYARHLVSGPRLPFTAAYFGSIALTLYFAIGVSLFPFLDRSMVDLLPIPVISLSHIATVARRGRKKEGASCILLFGLS